LRGQWPVKGVGQGWLVQVMRLNFEEIQRRKIKALTMFTFY